MGEGMDTLNQYIVQLKLILHCMLNNRNLNKSLGKKYPPKQNNSKKELKLKKEIRFVVGFQRCVRGNWRKVVKDTNFSYKINNRYVMYNMITIVNGTIWYI